MSRNRRRRRDRPPCPIDDGRRAYNGDKTSINYMYALASFYGKNENFDSAFVLYDKLLKLLPGNTNILGNYGWYKIVAGRFDDTQRG
jgi:Tfp pilus assembly protein PilF